MPRKHEPLGVDSAIVFGLAFAASLHAMRSREEKYGYVHPETMLTPVMDAIRALRQWNFSKVNEPERQEPPDAR